MSTVGCIHPLDAFTPQHTLSTLDVSGRCLTVFASASKKLAHVTIYGDSCGSRTSHRPGSLAFGALEQLPGTASHVRETTRLPSCKPVRTWCNVGSWQLAMVWCKFSLGGSRIACMPAHAPDAKVPVERKSSLLSRPRSGPFFMWNDGAHRNLAPNFPARRRRRRHRLGHRHARKEGP
jgi:hypothetical protein